MKKYKNNLHLGIGIKFYFPKWDFYPIETTLARIYYNCGRQETVISKTSKEKTDERRIRRVGSRILKGGKS